MRPFLIVFLLAVGVTGANAQLTVKQYQEIIDTKNADAVNLVRTYVKGMGDGILFASIRGEDALQNKPLLCQPDKLALQTENFLDIIDREIKKAASVMTKDKLDAIPLATILLSGLQETFPCKAK